MFLREYAEEAGLPQSFATSTGSSGSFLTSEDGDHRIFAVVLIGLILLVLLFVGCYCAWRRRQLGGWSLQPESVVEVSAVPAK